MPFSSVSELLGIQTDDPLSEIGHRPYAVPHLPWIMHQSWEDLLFVHWSLPRDQIASVMPQPLARYLDSWRGTAWLGVVAFNTGSARLRWMPSVPWMSSFPEVNVRTYVTVHGKPGVYFFSLDAYNFAAVQAAQAGFGLNYRYAKIVMERRGRDHYIDSERDSSQIPARFNATYTPVTQHPQTVRPDSLEYFLLERYCVYAIRGGSVLRGDIHHRPWSFQFARADIAAAEIVAATGIRLPDQAPICHFSARQSVYFWWPQQQAL